MKRSMLIGVLGIAVVLMAGGCKKVQTTFVNTTNQTLELTVDGPGNGVGYLGEIPSGGQLTTLIEVSPVHLPKTYNFTAGPYQEAFSITSDSEDRIMVVIPDGAKAPKNAKISRSGAMLGSPAPVITAP